MSGRNKNWELTLAAPEDSPGMQKVFDDGDFDGDISVRFSRAPDPFGSFQNDGDHVVMPVVKEAATGDILGLGGCVIRRAYVNGEIKNTGYLTGLKILRSHQGKLNCIWQAYDMIAENCARFNPIYYTTILESNEPAIKMLERPRKYMPSYIFLGMYTVFCLGTGGRMRGDRYGLKRGHSPQLSEFYAEHLPKYNLAPANEVLYGLSGDDFYCLQSPAGEILAACAVWNQQSYKQYLISGYKGVYKAMSHLPTRFLGYPRMPKAGSAANYASIASLVVPEENRNVAVPFLKLVQSEAREYDFVLLGLFENHHLAEEATKLRHFKYRSRLYAVDYEKSEEERLRTGLIERPILLEAGML